MEKETKRQIKLYIVMIVGFSVFVFSFVNFLLTNRIEYLSSDHMNHSWLYFSVIMYAFGVTIALWTALIAAIKNGFLCAVGGLLYAAFSRVWKLLFD